MNDAAPEPPVGREGPDMDADLGTDATGARSGLSRRSLIIGSSAATVGVIGGGYVVSRARGASGRATSQNPVDRWLSTAGPPYFIAHRGTGVVVPEHTAESYEAALAWGATCLEISVAKTSDDVLICMHDLTYDRTTNLSGVVADQPSTVLEKGRVSIPRLGPRWLGARSPTIPLLEDVLEKVGSGAILCIEAKNDSAFDPMLRLIRRNGLTDSVFAKVHMPARARVAQARAVGIPIFMYAGGAADLVPARIEPVLAGLDKARDVIVIPAVVNNRPIDERTVRRVVQSGVSTWAYPVSRRSDVTRLRALGVEGFITPDIGYVSGSIPPQRSDDWAMGRMTSGQLTGDPYSDVFTLRWPGQGVLALDFQRPSYVLLGQLCPIARPDQSYTLEFDVRFDRLPRDRRAHVSVAFGHAGDEYYEHQQAQSPGYHAVLRADGEMAIFAHDGRPGAGDPISPAVQTRALVAGGWTRVRLEVTPQTLTWSRTGSAPVNARDAQWRGGYLHVGRSGPDGPLSLRALKVSVR